MCYLLYDWRNFIFYKWNISSNNKRRIRRNRKYLYSKKNIRKSLSKSDSNINIISPKNDIALDNSNTDFNNLQNDINLNEDLTKGKKQESINNMVDDDIGKEESQNSENSKNVDNEKKVEEEHEEKKTDNPYDIPEDF